MSAWREASSDFDHRPAAKGVKYKLRHCQQAIVRVARCDKLYADRHPVRTRVSRERDRRSTQLCPDTLEAVIARVMQAERRLALRRWVSAARRHRQRRHGAAGDIHQRASSASM